MLLKRFNLLLNNDSGAIAVKFAVLLPMLAMIMAIAIEMGRYTTLKSELQSAVDSASLAAAKELSLSDRNASDLPQIAKAMVDARVNANGVTGGGRSPATKTIVQDDKLSVQVTTTLPFDSIFEGLLGIVVSEVTSTSVARVVGQPNICVLGLNSSEQGTISLEKNARVTGQNCAVFSNSDHNRGLKAKNSSSLEASVICSRGGKDGGPGNFSPEPLVDCPSFEDPLASRPEPEAGNCDPTMPSIVDSEIELDPGTYCGLEITTGGHVKLKEGIYIIKDKPLIVSDGGRLTGTEAGLFFTGAKSFFKFDIDSTISLTAPKSGKMAGLLVFAARTQSDSLTYSILSNDARLMVGTIYIPKGELRVDAESPIADKSAYTAIVADKMRLYGGPHLVLNTNYNDTDIPVPVGIRGVGQPTKLVK